MADAEGRLRAAAETARMPLGIGRGRTRIPADRRPSRCTPPQACLAPKHPKATSSPNQPRSLPSGTRFDSAPLCHPPVCLKTLPPRQHRPRHRRRSMTWCKAFGPIDERSPCRPDPHAASRRAHGRTRAARGRSGFLHERFPPAHTRTQPPAAHRLSARTNSLPARPNPSAEAQAPNRTNEPPATPAGRAKLHERFMPQHVRTRRRRAGRAGEPSPANADAPETSPWPSRPRLRNEPDAPADIRGP